MPRKSSPSKIYCLRCKKRVDATNVKQVSVNNARRGKVPMLKGNCPSCGGKVCKING